MNTKKIPFIGEYPSYNVKDSVKESKEYGLLYAKQMISDFQGRDAEYLNTRRKRFKQARRYREGSQDAMKYLDLIDVNGENSSINLNPQPLPIIAKFIDVVVGGLTSLDYEVKANAIDPVAQSEREEERKKILTKLFMKPFKKKLGDKLGIDLMGSESAKVEEIETSEEVELHMQLNYKQAIEIAVEQAIKFIFELNEYGEIRKNIIDDLCTNNLAGTRTYIDSNYGIRTRRILPENLIFSYTDKSTMDDIRHCGEVKVMSISELRRMFPNEPESTWEGIAKIASKQNNPDKVADEYTGNQLYGYYEKTYDSFSVSVMDFEFLTTNKLRYEKKKTKSGKELLKKRGENYEPPRNYNGSREMIEREYEVVYGGYYVIGTDYVLGYGKKKNMPRSGSQLSKTSLSFKLYCPNIYRKESKSLVERMIPHADEMQIAQLKIQQLVAKARPAGLLIDVEGLYDIQVDANGVSDPIDLITIYNQTGNMIWRSRNDAGDVQKPPFQELGNGVNVGQLQALISHYNTQLQMIRDVTGINEVRDATKPSADALVGTQKLALAASNNATRFIHKGEISITKRTAEIVILHLQDIVKYNKEFKNYKAALGSQTSETIKQIQNIPLHEFGIVIDVEPDEYEKEVMNARVQASIARGELRIEDAIAIDSIWNPKLANQMLILRRKKYQKEKMQEAQANAAAQAQANAQAAQMAAQAEMQKEQMIYQLKAQYDSVETANNIKEIDAKYRWEMQISGMKGQVDLAKSDLDSQSKMKIENEKEDRKDERTKIQATQQSKMIEQRNNDSGAKDFTKEEQNEVEKILKSVKPRNEQGI